MSLAAMALRHGRGLFFVAVACTAAGLYAGPKLPKGVYPEVTFPRIAVVAKVPALTVANMDVKVTQPLEQAVSTVIGVAQVRSKTIRGGSELSIDLNPGTDMRRAEQLTWNRIGAIRSQLPPDLELTLADGRPAGSASRGSARNSRRRSRARGRRRW